MDTEQMYADFAQQHNKLSKLVRSLQESSKEKDERINKLETLIKNLSNENKSMKKLWIWQKMTAKKS